MNISIHSLVSPKKNKQRSDVIMKSKTQKKIIISLAAGFLLASLPVVLVGAKMMTVKDQDNKLSSLNYDVKQSNQVIFLTLMDLVEQSINHAQTTMQTMLEEMPSDIQPSMALRDFSNNNIFSVRGLA
jgi:predicted RNA methylase